MATFSITDQTRRAQFTANGSTTEFSFSFQVNNTSEIKVDIDGTLKTESTHYDIKTSSDSIGLNADGTGKVVFRTSPSDHTPANNEVVSVFSDLPLSRTSVYTTGGNITATSLENDFDTITMILASHEERLDRTMVAPVRDAVDVDLTLPDKDDRKGRVLGFNATTGAAEQGPEIADVQSLAAITADIQTLAHIEDGTDATDAIQTVAGISSNVSTVAGVSANVTTVAGNTTNINTVAGVSANVTTVAGISSNVTTVAGISSDVTTAAGISSDITTAATVFDSSFRTNVNTLAGVSTAVDALGPISSDITAVANDATDIGNVAGAITNINLVASNINSGILTAINDFGSVANAAVSTNDYGSL